MPKVDCSELEATIAAIALKLGESPQFDTLDKVATEMRRTIPEITREEIVNSIVSATGQGERTVSDLRKQIGALKREARQDKALRDRIALLEESLQGGTMPRKGERRQLPTTQVVEDLRSIRDQLAKEIRGSTPAVRQRLEKSIADLQQRLKKGVILSPQRKTEPAESNDLQRLIYERGKLRRTINARIRSLKPKTIWGHIAEPVNTSRAIMTSIDFSAVLRQGGFIVLAHPLRGVRSIPAMLRSFASDKAARDVMAEIEARPNAPLYDRSGLYLGPVDSDARLGKQEEQYMSRWADRIPGVAASQRAYVVFLNKLRADSFDTMAASLARNGEPTLPEAKALANFINVATGRGPLGKAEQAAVVLNTVFFAPRYVTSRFELLALQPLWRGTGRTRAMIAQEYARYLIGLGTLYALSWWAFGDDDDFSIEFDPRSSDFGKLRFGPVRLDPLSGLSQTAVVTTRIAMGETKSTTTGEVRPIRGEGVKFGQGDTAEVIGRFLRSKFSPSIGAAVNISSGQNVIGEPVTPQGELGRLFVPLSFREVGEIAKEEGVPEATAFGLAAIFGAGVQRYSEPETKRTRSSRRSSLRAGGSGLR